VTCWSPRNDHADLKPEALSDAVTVIAGMPARICKATESRMCELFAMSARYPSTVRLSLEEFSRHGGLSGPHKDGWGIAWYDERDVRLVKETSPAAGSPCVRFIQDNPFVSPFVISHVRKATRGAVALRNCQPFGARTRRCVAQLCPQRRSGGYRARRALAGRRVPAGR
jgi:glutamine amidotransferase